MDGAVDSLYERVVREYPDVLRKAGYLCFAGTRIPVQGEGVLVLAGVTTPFELPTVRHRRLLIPGSPPQQVEHPTRNVLWSAAEGAQPLPYRSFKRRGISGHYL